jgi:hypothetical protein
MRRLTSRTALPSWGLSSLGILAGGTPEKVMHGADGGTEYKGWAKVIFTMWAAGIELSRFRIAILCGAGDDVGI